MTCPLPFSRFQEEGEVKYLEEARDLVKPERNTLEVSFVDIDKFSQNLATIIVEEFYRSVVELDSPQWLILLCYC